MHIDILRLINVYMGVGGGGRRKGKLINEAKGVGWETNERRKREYRANKCIHKSGRETPRRGLCMQRGTEMPRRRLCIDVFIHM